MSQLLALILGVIQGLTEFFPVSSSAHLELAKLIAGVKNAPALFDLACHTGTLLALLWFFRTDIKTIPNRAVSLFLALIPLVPTYFAFKYLKVWLGGPELMGVYLMVTAGLLFVGQKAPVRPKTRPYRDALLIGLMQSCALLPGISRSGSTISCARLLGWSPKEAVRFSFILAIPTIAGGTLMEGQKLVKEGLAKALLDPTCLIGFFTSFVVGLLVIKLAVGWLESGRLRTFAWYCLTLGVLLNLYYLIGR